MITKEERTERVKAFNDQCLAAGFTPLAENVYELRGNFSRTLTLCTLIHGNEIGGMEVFLKLLQELKTGVLKPKSNLRLILGNVEAYYADKRYLETDMNRSFGLSDPLTREELRAKELENFFESSDVLVDIHQTIGKTGTGFFIYEFDIGTYNYSRYLHEKLPIVTYSAKRPFKGQTSTAFTIGKGKVALTIETGQKGIEETQISLGLQVARKAIETEIEKAIPDLPWTETFTFSQIVHNPDRSLEMVREYRNFEPVKKGEIIARNQEKEVQSEVDGVILFAKYGDYAKSAPELALVLRAVHSRNEI